MIEEEKKQTFNWVTVCIKASVSINSMNEEDVNVLTAADFLYLNSSFCHVSFYFFPLLLFMSILTSLKAVRALYRSLASLVGRRFFLFY